MKASDIIGKTSLKDLLEAPLQSYELLGDFEKTGPFLAKDRKLVANPVNMMKTRTFFSKADANFRLFFANIRGVGKYGETGEVDEDRLRKIIGPEAAEQVINGADDAINVVYVNNTGDEKVPMTPWIMAHRMGHAFARMSNGGTVRYVWEEYQKWLSNTILNTILVGFYGYNRGEAVKGSGWIEHAGAMAAVANAIGTQRSSRNREIKRPYEFCFELLAQYISSGRITLNHLPSELKIGTRHYRLNDKDQADVTEMFARDCAMMLDDVLSVAIGRIFVM